ncbi:MAG: DNA alkylation repair protein [Granulosicoccus sp.]|nr:DNA alkylation repair protein [Granulosicoccus sp.]
MKAKVIQNHLRSLADPEVAEKSQRFFKTGKGDYGEGDRFLGIRVPILRAQVTQYGELSLIEIGRLLKSNFHEERHFALMLLVRQFSKRDAVQRKAIYEFYLDNTRYINNWDLVDCSAPGIVGVYLEGNSRRLLYALAESTSLWERRIAIISTLHFIKKDDFADTLKISALLLNDGEDLIHKAVGWMLREVGNRDFSVEEKFLKKNYRDMPRTMLRYAIEKFPGEMRKSYLDGSA